MTLSESSNLIELSSAENFNVSYIPNLKNIVFNIVINHGNYLKRKIILLKLNIIF